MSQTKTQLFDVSVEGPTALKNGAFDLTLGSGGDVTISDGNLVVANGHGIDFSATADGNGTITSELLDDYEEGTWTPDFSGRTSAAPNIQEGLYRKIGKQVFAYFHLNANTTLTCNISTVRIVGLPFNPTGSGNVYGHASSIHFNNSFNVGNTEAFLNGLVPPTGNYLSIYFNQGASVFEVPVSRFGTGNILACVEYFVD